MLRVGASGRVDRVVVGEQSPGNLCLAEAVRTAQLPPPPEDGYWTRIALEGREAAPEIDAAKRAARERGSGPE